MPTANALLQVLPPYSRRSIVVEKNQEVHDIMREVLNAHSHFTRDYDLIAQYFCKQTLFDTCRDLFSFCKMNIKYKIESENEQTTRSPAAILEMGNGDCKHYASFIGGVLSAITRECGTPINWSYRFASYDWFNSTPQHVFVVVKDGANEIWVDPVLAKFNQRTPTPAFYQDKKEKKMSLQRLSGTNGYQQNTIGWTIETSTGYTTSGPTIVPKITDPFYGKDYLGLSRYGGASGTNLDTLTAQLQKEIDAGPSPYTLSRSLVEKILRDNVQNWNFYYPNGTSPNPRKWQEDFGHYLNIILTPDQRLTFDRDVEPPHNLPEIHHIVDQVNYYVQQFGETPYIVLIDHLKRLGKGWKTPGEGSLWSLIHTGDVNYKAISTAVQKIPGLDSFLKSFGVSLDSLKEFATKFFNKATGGGGVIVPPIPTPDDEKEGISPVMIAALAGGAYYFATKKKRVSGPGNFLIPILIGTGLYFFLTTGKNNGISVTLDQKRAALNNLDASPVWNQMTPAEVAATYDWVFNYVQTDKKSSAPASLVSSIQTIGNKYNIFT